MSKKHTSLSPVYLTSIIEALEAFQAFDPNIKTSAIALYAAELGIAKLHFYAIALYAGFGGAVK